MKTWTMDVEGMACQGCASSVENALKEVEGVREVEVSLDDERARVVADDGVAGNALVGAVEKAGYAAGAPAS